MESRANRWSVGQGVLMAAILLAAMGVWGVVAWLATRAFLLGR